MPLRLGLVVEDGRFVDFLTPCLERLARDSHVAVSISVLGKTNGCRTEVLRTHCRDVVGVDQLVIGVDSSGTSHAEQGLTYRQKARRINDVLAGVAPAPLLAVAQPSVEAWIYADPRGFSEGLSAALGVPFRAPANWPQPKNERQAKDLLGRLIKDGTGEVLPRASFEFAGQIVQRARLVDSDNRSLADFSRITTTCLQRRSPR